MASGPCYGPFHRKKSLTQQRSDAWLQLQSGEVWGTTARWGFSPAVKAYRGPLPAGDEGIEFTTTIAPSAGSHPHDVFWRSGDPGVGSAQRNGVDYAVIPVTVTKCVYSGP